MELRFHLGCHAPRRRIQYANFLCLLISRHSRAMTLCLLMCAAIVPGRRVCDRDEDVRPRGAFDDLLLSSSEKQTSFVSA